MGFALSTVWRGVSGRLSIEGRPLGMFLAPRYAICSCRSLSLLRPGGGAFEMPRRLLSTGSIWTDLPVFPCSEICPEPLFSRRDNSPLPEQLQEG